jgi:hypothetical protein
MTLPLLLAADSVNVVVVPPMEGVTTAIVLFIFVCVVYPSLVKHKTQFYGAFGAVLAIILLHSLNIMFGGTSAGFQVFSGGLIGLLQVAAIVLLFMSCGGVGVREIAGEMARAYEVIRRGEEEKTVIIPIGSEQPRGREQPPPRAPVGTPTEAPPAQEINLPPQAGWPKKSDDSSIPLE